MFIESDCQMDCNIYNHNKYVENILESELPKLKRYFFYVCMNNSNIWLAAQTFDFGLPHINIWKYQSIYSQVYAYTLKSHRNKNGAKISK